MTAQTMQAIFQDGVLGWIDAMSNKPTGSFVKSNIDQLATKCDRIFLNGSMSGHIRWSPEELVPKSGLVREGQLAFMIHSGSRNVGKYVGGMWRDHAQALWKEGLKYPGFPIVSPLFSHSPRNRF